MNAALSRRIRLVLLALALAGTGLLTASTLHAQEDKRQSLSLELLGTGDAGFLAIVQDHGTYRTPFSKLLPSTTCGSLADCKVLAEHMKHAGVVGWPAEEGPGRRIWVVEVKPQESEPGMEPYDPDARYAFNLLEIAECGPTDVCPDDGPGIIDPRPGDPGCGPGQVCPDDGAGLAGPSLGDSGCGPAGVCPDDGGPGPADPRPDDPGCGPQDVCPDPGRALFDGMNDGHFKTIKEIPLNWRSRRYIRRLINETEQGKKDESQP